MFTFLVIKERSKRDKMKQQNLENITISEGTNLDKKSFINHSLSINPLNSYLINFTIIGEELLF